VTDRQTNGRTDGHNCLINIVRHHCYADARWKPYHVDARITWLLLFILWTIVLEHAWYQTTKQNNTYNAVCTLWCRFVVHVRRAAALHVVPFCRPGLGVAWGGALVMTTAITTKIKLTKDNTIIMFAAVAIIKRRRRRREARNGREWSRKWLKERQTGKHVEDFETTALTSDTGGLHNLTVSVSLSV